ncbi:hypothetical protein H6G89_01665 [Oscillatoria sp. FACHB-1407]|uniref:hypothetical protein n=1 Tax=Oscillatoria sp. FACHB-1407 TaxID=2692847 RepID=UPI0016888B59|nr:hypothetical protein [Oscillatoria sp. FACHB-1407]MBD2459739.1 hypothetical protein [Oscillatoria sp. FACHB-1407]
MTLLNSKKLYSNSDALEQKFDFVLQVAKQKSSTKLRSTLKKSPAQSPSKLKSVSQPATPHAQPTVRVQVSTVPVAQKKSQYWMRGLSLAAGVVILSGVGLKVGLGELAASTSVPSPDATSALPVSYEQVTPPVAEPIDTFAEGQAIAQQALGWSQSAASVDDWIMVSHKLEKAIQLLQAVPASSANYDTAQTRIVELQEQLAIAQRNTNQTIPRDVGLSAAVSSTETQTVGSGRCPSISTTPESLPVEINQVDFQGANDDSGADYLIGCITNHTSQPITQLSLIYKATSANAPDIFRTGREDIIPVEVQPGQTVAFRSSFTINPLFQTVEIQGISWMPPDGEEAQTTSTVVQLTR